MQVLLHRRMALHLWKYDIYNNTADKYLMTYQPLFYQVEL